jgi:hypothetical protein
MFKGRCVTYSALIALLILIVGVLPTTHAQVQVSSNVYITAEVIGSAGQGGSVPGGGGSSSNPNANTSTLPITVNFSGMAYPSSKVVILQDGTPVVNTVADPNANFSASVSNLSAGNYTFTIYAEDSSGNKSADFTFPLYLTVGSSITIGGVILAPTINVQKLEVRRGDNEPIFGFTTPDSQVNIMVHSSAPYFVSATSSVAGAYLYNFDTTPLEYGTHNAQSRALVGPKVSAETDPVSFVVSNENVAKNNNTCGTIVGDLNCDGKVNLVDFSIMAYWYKKGTTPPSIVDLNGDGKITLVDFSILAYHWTG